MRKLVLSMLIVAALAPAAATAAAAVNKPPGAAPAAAAADDLIRRIERDIDRLTRGLNSDVQHIDKKRQPSTTPATGSSPLIRQ